jgi:hypothetical protein
MGSLDPIQIAETANRGFIKIVRSLLCLVTWRKPFGSPGPCEPQESFLAVTQDQATGAEPAISPNSAAGGQQHMLRALFLADAVHRLAAVRWIRRHGTSEALPTLESVLTIEEDREVGEEIARTVERLKHLGPTDQGGSRCSRS